MFFEIYLWDLICLCLSRGGYLTLSVQKTKNMTFGPITSWQIDGETVADFIFLGSRITADGD